MFGFRHTLQAMMMMVATLLTAMYWGTGADYKLYAANIGVMAQSMLRLVSYMLGGFVAMQVASAFKRRLYYIALIGNLKAMLCLTAGLLGPHKKRGTTCMPCLQA